MRQRALLLQRRRPQPLRLDAEPISAALRFGCSSAQDVALLRGLRVGAVRAPAGGRNHHSLPAGTSTTILDHRHVSVSLANQMYLLSIVNVCMEELRSKDRPLRS